MVLVSKLWSCWYNKMLYTRIKCWEQRHIGLSTKSIFECATGQLIFWITSMSFNVEISERSGFIGRWLSVSGAKPSHHIHRSFHFWRITYRRLSKTAALRPQTNRGFEVHFRRQEMAWAKRVTIADGYPAQKEKPTLSQRIKPGKNTARLTQDDTASLTSLKPFRRRVHNTDHDRSCFFFPSLP